jgi:hypothetical protein
MRGSYLFQHGSDCDGGFATEREEALVTGKGTIPEAICFVISVFMQENASLEGGLQYRPVSA